MYCAACGGIPQDLATVMPLGAELGGAMHEGPRNRPDQSVDSLILCDSQDLHLQRRHHWPDRSDAELRSQ